MRKSDVDIYDNLPSVNVKVHNMWQWEQYVPKVAADEAADPGFTDEWISDHVSDDEMSMWFEDACSFETEYVEGYAQELFGEHVKCYREGRSGGHLTVHGLEDVDSWDAIYLARWAKFAKFTREVADDIPYQVISLIHINVYEPEQAVPTIEAWEVS